MVVSGQIWQDPCMRQGWVWAVMIAAVGWFSACSQKVAVAATPDDVLVLEVGGDQESLRAALVALGREVGPAYALAPRPAASSREVVDPNRNGAPDEPPFALGGPTIPPSPRPEAKGPGNPQPGLEVKPERESEWVTVPLPEGETLIHVARRHLGDGRRFGELLEWNGWSDADARRLKRDQPVKIKRSEMRGTGG